MKRQQEYALLMAMDDAIKNRINEMKEEMLDSWAADGITSAEVDFAGRRLGKVGIRRTETLVPVVTDPEEFGGFAREAFRKEVVTIDAALLPPEVLQELADNYGAVSACEVETDWRSEVCCTPDGRVVTRDGEPVPGTCAVSKTTRTLAFTKEKGIGYGDILRDARESLPQAIKMLEGVR